MPTHRCSPAVAARLAAQTPAESPSALLSARTRAPPGVAPGSAAGTKSRSWLPAVPRLDESSSVPHPRDVAGAAATGRHAPCSSGARVSPGRRACRFRSRAKAWRATPGQSRQRSLGHATGACGRSRSALPGDQRASRGREPRGACVYGYPYSRLRSARVAVWLHNPGAAMVARSRARRLAVRGSPGRSPSRVI